MKMKDLLTEEGYDRQRDADAVSGKPRKTSIGGGKKPKGYSKDKAEKAAMDNVKKALAKENSAGSVAGVAMGVGPMLTRQPKNADGTAVNALDMVTKKSKKRKNR